METAGRAAIGVRVLHLEGCEATGSTVERIRDVASALGVSIRLERSLITTEDEAVRLRFLGSPTVQVEALDIEVAARSSRAFGLT
jgi:hypothetical protein